MHSARKPGEHREFLPETWQAIVSRRIVLDRQDGVEASGGESVFEAGVRCMCPRDCDGGGGGPAESGPMAVRNFQFAINAGGVVPLFV